MTITKWFVIIGLALLVAKDSDVRYKCVKWQYRDYISFQVQCLKWEKIDCLNRLHKGICRLGV